MVRRVSPSQLRNILRQAQQKQRQAISNYNDAVRKHNREVTSSVNKYNQAVRAHNARVRSNRDRLRRELARLNSSSPTTGRLTYRASVHRLSESFTRIERSVNAGTWTGGEQLLDLSEAEAANSVAVLNALLANTAEAPATDDELAALQATSITDELSAIDPDLDARWRGALFALNPRNPDAARHFCTSSREILDAMLVASASDADVMAATPAYPRTPEGGVSRRARIRYSLDRRGSDDAELEAFLDADLDDVIALFREFNAGTHGGAGRFNLRQLAALKTRVEDAIRFLHVIVS